MSKNKHYECTSCDAVFRLRHDLDENYYTVAHCPFCGTELDADSNFDIDEDLEE
jgi:uncharacterized paraquat-inducible protein A